MNGGPSEEIQVDFVVVYMKHEKFEVLKIPWIQIYCMGIALKHQRGTQGP